MLCGWSQVSGLGVPSTDGFAISLPGVPRLCKLPFLPSTWRWTRREKCILENQWRPGKQHTQASCGIRESQGEDDLWGHEVLRFNNNLSWPDQRVKGKMLGINTSITWAHIQELGGKSLRWEKPVDSQRSLHANPQNCPLYPKVECFIMCDLVGLFGGLKVLLPIINMGYFPAPRVL